MGEELILFSKNVPLAAFEPYGRLGVGVTKIFDENVHLLPFGARGADMEAAIGRWLCRRITGKGLWMLEAMGHPGGQRLFDMLAATHGVAAIDAFRVGRGDSAWTDMHAAGISEAIGEFSLFGTNVRVARDALMDGEISPDFTLDGAQRKAWAWRGGRLFLVKADLCHKKDAPSQSAAEGLACGIAASLGLDAVRYETEMMEIDGKEEIASVCPCMADSDTGFAPADEFLRAVGMECPDMDVGMGWHGKMLVAWRGYADMMAFDAIVGNPDRHPGNFGVLFDTNTGDAIGPSPLFDNGLSFSGTAFGGKFRHFACSCWMPFPKQMREFAPRSSISAEMAASLAPCVSERLFPGGAGEAVQERLREGVGMFLEAKK